MYRWSVQTTLEYTLEEEVSSVDPIHKGATNGESPEWRHEEKMIMRLIEKGVPEFTVLTWKSKRKRFNFIEDRPYMIVVWPLRMFIYSFDVYGIDFDR